MTGPGCAACEFKGHVPFDPAIPRVRHPCMACSPWTQERVVDDREEIARLAAVAFDAHREITAGDPWTNVAKAVRAEILKGSGR